MSRHLIVNADDFGLTPGVSRGIARAHLMVLEPGAQHAATLAAELPDLDVGLHAVMPRNRDWPGALGAQLRRFIALMGRPPTHLDSHHHVHTAPDALPHFRRVADELAIPVRGSSPAALLTRFYGRWDGASHPEWLATANLLRLLDEASGSDWIELMCHPGVVDGGLRSSYAVEREVELQTLCDPRLQAGLAERGITLSRFSDLVAEAV
jgi:chitin disaccharide deacetylase